MKDRDREHHLVRHLYLHDGVVGGLGSRDVRYGWLDPPLATFALLRLEAFGNGLGGGHSLEGCTKSCMIE